MAAMSGQILRHKELYDSLQHIMQKAKGGICNQTCRPESGKRSRLKSVRKRGMLACFSYLWVDGLLTTGRMGRYESQSALPLRTNKVHKIELRVLIWSLASCKARGLKEEEEKREKKKKESDVLDE